MPRTWWCAMVSGPVGAGLCRKCRAIESAAAGGGRPGRAVAYPLRARNMAALALAGRGTGFAASSDVSSHQLAVVGPNRSLGRQRALELCVLEHVTIKAWDRLLFVEC